jgi:hypothetical protein
MVPLEGEVVQPLGTGSVDLRVASIRAQLAGDEADRQQLRCLV